MPLLALIALIYLVVLAYWHTAVHDWHPEYSLHVLGSHSPIIVYSLASAGCIVIGSCGCAPSVLLNCMLDNCCPAIVLYQLRPVVFGVSWLVLLSPLCLHAPRVMHLCCICFT